jgi:hypothetical protein
MSRTNIGISTLTAVLLLVLLSTGSALAGVYTTNSDATIVNENTHYGAPPDVYLSGGPQNMSASGLADGDYYYQVTDPSGKVLLSTDNAVCRQLTVAGGRVTGATGPCPHADGTANLANGVTPVQLVPFSATPNMGTVYKAWMIPVGQASIDFDLVTLNFARRNAMTDNFKIPSFTPPPTGSCQPSSSLSVLETGTDVTAYVPKGSWSGGATGVSVINIEGNLIPAPVKVPTPSIVNSCASNSTTGVTACSANTTDVYVFSGTTLNHTVVSGASGAIFFSGGACTNCGIMMDATNNRAAVAMSLAGVLPAGSGGFQFLDLAPAIPVFPNPPFPSMTPAGGFGNISEDALIDPIRNLLLSATENNEYELIDVSVTPVPATAYFESGVIPVPGGAIFDSSGEDCTTGIALAPAEFSGPSVVYIADLTQALFVAGAGPPPGTWSAVGASQLQSLSGSFLPAGASGLAVAQGALHQGVVSGEFGGDGITAIQLPSTSGFGMPAISDWVTCNIGGGWSHGLDPHTVTAYESPNAPNHAFAVLANINASTVAVVDLTDMLNPAIVPRNVAGDVCAAGTLPAAVVSFIAVPL